MFSHFVQMAAGLEPPSITIFSNGPFSQEEPFQKSLQVCKAFGATLDEREIVRLVNNGPSHTDGVTIHFETGEPVTMGFLVNKPPTVNRAQHLIDQLGLETEEGPMGGHIKITNPMFNSTSVHGVFCRWRYNGRHETGSDGDGGGPESSYRRRDAAVSGESRGCGEEFIVIDLYSLDRKIVLFFDVIILGQYMQPTD